MIIYVVDFDGRFVTIALYLLGNFSTVHRARYTYQERQGGPLGSIVVAVKEPSAAYASELQREIEIMAHIQHPNIVTLIGIVQRQFRFLMWPYFRLDG